MNGHLHLKAGCYENGRTYLREQSFRAPLHISKPHEDAGALVVNIVNPTAGIFDGDTIELSAEAEAGASLVLTTPSASRVYRSRSGGPAKVLQSFTAHAGATLEFFPEPFIPQAGARCELATELRADLGAMVVFFDWLTPGRVASGEVFRYASLSWDLDAFWAGQLVARERYLLRPEDDSLEALRLAGPQTHYVSCIVLGGEMPDVAELEALGGSGVYLGHGPLVNGGWTVKALCDDSLRARHLLHSLRALMYRAWKRPMPTLGRA